MGVIDFGLEKGTKLALFIPILFYIKKRWPVFYICIKTLLFNADVSIGDFGIHLEHHLAT